MKQPSIWKQILDENQLFVDQFISEGTFEKAGLTQLDNQIVCRKRDAKVLRGVTKTAPGPWQVRFTINGRQEILFVCRCLTVAALMRDLLLTMLLRYPHCAKVKQLDPKSEHADFNLPLAVRELYDGQSITPERTSVFEFLERVEKLLLDKGILYPITPEEAAARDQIALQSAKQADTSAQLRYQKRRSTQLDQALEQIHTFGESASKLEELRARLYDWMDRKDASIGVVSQQIEFMAAEFESLKQAVGTMTATFQHLIDTANEHDNRNTKAG